MSGQALGWVFEDSPMKGATFLVHLALADVANDLHDHELWCSTTTIAKKCRLTRFQVGRSLTALVDAGLLELLEKRPGRTDRYRFVLPIPVTQSHRSAHEAGEEPVTDDHTGVTDGHRTGDSGSHELKHSEDEPSSREQVSTDLDDFEYLQHDRNPDALAELVADRFAKRADLS